MAMTHAQTRFEPRISAAGLTARSLQATAASVSWMPAAKAMPPRDRALRSRRLRLFIGGSLKTFCPCPSVFCAGPGGEGRWSHPAEPFGIFAEPPLTATVEP